MKIINPRLNVRTFDKKPPQLEVIEVTKENYHDVSDYIGAREVHLQRIGGGELKLNFVFGDGSENIKISFPATPVENYRVYVAREKEEYAKWRTITDYKLHTEWVETPGSINTENTTKQENN